MTKEKKEKKSSNGRAALYIGGIALIGMIGSIVYGYSVGYDYGLQNGIVTGKLNAQNAYNTLVAAYPDKREDFALTLAQAES